MQLSMSGRASFHRRLKPLEAVQGPHLLPAADSLAQCPVDLQVQAIRLAGRQIGAAQHLVDHHTDAVGLFDRQVGRPQLLGGDPPDTAQKKNKEPHGSHEGEHVLQDADHRRPPHRAPPRERKKVFVGDRFIDEDRQHIQPKEVVIGHEQLQRQLQDHERQVEDRKEDPDVEVLDVAHVAAAVQQQFHGQSRKGQHDQQGDRRVHPGIIDELRETMQQVVAEAVEQHTVAEVRRSDRLADQQEGHPVERREQEQDRHRIEVLAARPGDEFRDRAGRTDDDREPGQQDPLTHVDPAQAVGLVADEGRDERLDERPPRKAVRRGPLSASRAIVPLHTVPAITAYLAHDYTVITYIYIFSSE